MGGEAFCFAHLTNRLAHTRCVFSRQCAAHACHFFAVANDFSFVLFLNGVGMGAFCFARASCCARVARACAPRKLVNVRATFFHRQRVAHACIFVFCFSLGGVCMKVFCFARASFCARGALACALRKSVDARTECISSPTFRSCLYYLFFFYSGIVFLHVFPE